MMSTAFIGEIKMFAGIYVPRDWAACAGQILAVTENEPLFALLGATYGGDARVSFGLPDLRGRAPMHFGSGVGLTPRYLGQKGGIDTVTLTEDNLPSHTHSFQVNGSGGETSDPNSAVFAKSTNVAFVEGTPANQDTLDSVTIAEQGGGRAFDNRMPVLALNFIICLKGV